MSQAPALVAMFALAALAAFIIIKITQSKQSKPTDEAGHGPCENCGHVSFNMFESDGPHIDGMCSVERHLHDELCLNGAIERR